MPGLPDGAVVPCGCGAGYDARRQADHAARATSSPKAAIAPTTSTGISALMPGSGSATRAVPIGVSGDMATATPRRRHRPGGCGHARLGQPAAHQLGARRTQGRQRRVIYRACGQQAGGHLTYHQKRGSREHQREKSERDRLGPDGALNGRYLPIPVRH